MIQYSCMDEKSRKLFNTIIFISLIFSLCGTILSNLRNAAELVPLSLYILPVKGLLVIQALYCFLSITTPNLLPVWYNDSIIKSKG